MKKTSTLDFQRYQYAGLAASLAASREGTMYVPGALEVLAGEKGLNLGEEALGFIKGTQASKEGIATAINVYAKKFQDERGKYKPVELSDWYASVLKGLKKEEKAKILTALGVHNESLKGINEKYDRASYIASDDAPEGIFTSDQIDGAKKALKKYEDLMALLNILDNYKFEELRQDAVEVTRKNSLEALAKKL